MNENKKLYEPSSIVEALVKQTYAGSSINNFTPYCWHSLAGVPLMELDSRIVYVGFLRVNNAGSATIKCRGISVVVPFESNTLLIFDWIDTAGQKIQFSGWKFTFDDALFFPGSLATVANMSWWFGYNFADGILNLIVGIYVDWATHFSVFRSNGAQVGAILAAGAYQNIPSVHVDTYTIVPSNSDYSQLGLPSLFPVTGLNVHVTATYGGLTGSQVGGIRFLINFVEVDDYTAWLFRITDALYVDLPGVVFTPGVGNLVLEVFIPTAEFGNISHFLVATRDNFNNVIGLCMDIRSLIPV